MGGQDGVWGCDISFFHFIYLQCSDFVPGVDGENELEPFPGP